MGHGTAGTSKAAGLPDIQGYVNMTGSAGSGFWCNSKGGALNHSTEQSTHQFENAYGNGTYTGIIFVASGSNSIYGASSTVQPPALTMRFYIKY